MSDEPRIGGRDMLTGRQLAVDEVLAAVLSAGLANQAEELMKTGETAFVGAGGLTAWCNSAPPSLFLLVYPDAGSALTALLPGCGPPVAH